jgi:crotonobetainyl-CoA:carnitine CoA-transferase CaiB-like acyl-CoA transferase
MSGPMAGVKIVDLSAIISGPMATGLLADQGADVIKVEPLGIGDLCRWLGPNHKGIGAMFASVNRNKRSISLNLKSPEGISILKDLVKDADVFVQNFRPGAIGRMGLGPDILLALNPGLIYVSMSGFGEDGPYTRRRVYDPVIQAMSGFADSQGDQASGEPRLIQSIACDKVTALTTAQAITAALYARAAGKADGQTITLNMLDAAICFLWPDAYYNHMLLDNPAARSPDFGAFYGIMKTKDGFVTVITLSDDEFSDYCRAVGREDIHKDPRFQDVFSRMQNAQALRAAFAAELAGWTNADLRARLESEDVPHAFAISRDQVPDDAQIVHNGTLMETLHPVAGRLREPRPAAVYSATNPGMRLPAPLLGQDTNAILMTLGRSEADIARMRADGVIA